MTPDTGETNHMKPPLNRREFMAQATATTALAMTASTAMSGAGRAKNSLPKTATEKVALGNTGVQVSLVGMGTGSVGSGQASNQTRLGVKGFTNVVRHALDQGICFFDVADQYGSHTYLREALKGVPREQYVIQTKTHATNVADARSHLERYRMELGVDYIDILLLHCMTKEGWPADNRGSMEYLMQAKQEKIIRAHGTSCHGMDPLRTAAKNPFVEIDLARINPEGLIMDDHKPDEVASVLEEMHNAGKGIIGMKILGEGRISTPERKDASLRYVLGLGTVNAFIIGFENTGQIDDLLKRTADAIAFLKA
jgi:aryl-alcohol dehydrogenase-like predicted oxidoreductase